MVTLDRKANFKLHQQVQVWNPNYAFAYPALATNARTNEVGMSFEFGGGGNYENHVVGFWGDFVAYVTAGSNVGTTRLWRLRDDPPNTTHREESAGSVQRIRLWPQYRGKWLRAA